MIRNANWDHRYATGVSARFCPEADVARSCEEFLGKVTLTFGAPWSNTSTGHKIEDANLPKLEKPIVKHKQFLFSRFTNSFFFADMILTWPTSMVGEWDGKRIACGRAAGVIHARHGCKQGRAMHRWPGTLHASDFNVVNHGKPNAINHQNHHGLYHPSQIVGLWMLMALGCPHSSRFSPCLQQRFQRHLRHFRPGLRHGRVRHLLIIALLHGLKIRPDPNGPKLLQMMFDVLSP